MSTPPISAEDVNLVSEFLATEDIQLQTPTTITPSPNSNPTPAPGHLADCIVLCVSALLDPAERLFTALERNPTLTNTLLLCGGIGHSTPFLYAAVADHPRYKHLADEIAGLPEARVLYRLLTRCFDVSRIQSAGCRLLIEDRSTNCGANAALSKEVLDRNGVSASGLESVIIVQDPTMARRTIASFEKVYVSAERQIIFRSCPGFVPRVELCGGDLVFNGPGISADRLWSMSRFLGLIVGEIPRLRDDEAGYGPNGKGFIGHVDIPEEVEGAWERVKRVDGIAR